MSATAPSTVRTLRGDRRTAVMAAAIVLGLVGGGALVLRSTDAVFTANVENGPNEWSAASVAISSDLAATVMFSPTTDGTLVPGAPVLRKCIEVRYTGDSVAPVKLFASALNDSATTPTLGSSLNLVIEEGTGTAGVNCAGWVSGASIYTGTVAGFAADHSSYATGAGTWTTPAGAQNRMYRFSVSLPSNASSNLQGATMDASFTWETQLGS